MKIDKGIEMPENRTRWAFLANMEVGDSFLATAETITHPHRASAKASMWAIRNKNGWRFTQRTTPEGVRVWRVK